MLKLGRKTEYALISILHMAERTDAIPVSKREISEAYTIPNELLGKVLQSLKKASLVSSTQGPHGGYLLTKNVDDITIGEVMHATEGAQAYPECACVSSFCERQDVCNIKSMMDRFYNELNEFIHNVTIGQFRYDPQPSTQSNTCKIKRETIPCHRRKR